LDEGQELENSTRLAHLEVEAGGCPVVFRQHVRRFADGTGRCALSLSSLLSVPPPQCFFASHPAWYWHIPLFLFSWGILVFVMWLVGKMPLIGGGGIPRTRGVINGRITYRHPFIEMVSKFVGGILSFSAGLSLGREGPSVQIGSYVGSLVSRWTIS